MALRKSRRASTDGSNKRKEPDDDAELGADAREEPVVEAPPPSQPRTSLRLAKRTPRSAQVFPPTPPPFEGSAEGNNDASNGNGGDDDDDDAPDVVEMGSVREAVERKQQEELEAQERALAAKLQKQQAQDAREAEWAAQKATKQQRRRAASMNEEPMSPADTLPEGLLRVLGSMGTPEADRKKNGSGAGDGGKATRKEKKLLKRKLSQLWKTAGVTLKVDSAVNKVVDVKLAPALEDYVKERNAAIPRGSIRGQPKFVRGAQSK